MTARPGYPPSIRQAVYETRPMTALRPCRCAYCRTEHAERECPHCGAPRESDPRTQTRDLNQIVDSLSDMGLLTQL